MTSKEKTSCCFTGHRKIPPETISEISQRLEIIVVQLIEGGCTYFYSGGALGFDTLAAQTVLKCRAKYPQIRLVLVLPCRNQADHWCAKDKAVYEDILSAADEVIYTAQSYFKGCMHKRNRYLIEHSDICVCYLTENTSGTAYTVNYAIGKKLAIYNVAEK